MKKFAHLALTAVVMATSLVGTSAVLPAQAVAQEQPWAMVTYLRNGVPVGNIQLFCSGEEIVWGDTSNYTSVVWEYFSMCP